MKINKEENVLVTGHNGGSVTAKYNNPKIITQEEANEKMHKILNIEEEIGLDLTEERLHENCIINIYAISSYN